MFEFQFHFLLKFVPITIFQHWFGYWLWDEQVASRYLNQCFRLLAQICFTLPHRGKGTKWFPTHRKQYHIMQQQYSILDCGLSFCNQSCKRCSVISISANDDICFTSTAGLYIYLFAKLRETPKRISLNLRDTSVTINEQMVELLWCPDHHLHPGPPFH